MVTQSNDRISKAKELYKLAEERKAIEKREAELKEFFKGLLTKGVIEADEYAVVIEECERTGLDRPALEAEFGAAKIKKFEKVTEYTKVTVKKNK